MTDMRLKASATRALCGGVSDMTLFRWIKYRGFPKPIYIAGRRFWKEADVLAWLDAQGQADAATTAARESSAAAARAARTADREAAAAKARTASA